MNGDDQGLLALPSMQCMPGSRDRGARGPYRRGGNLVKLSPAEWNLLVRAIKTGELHEIDESQ